MLLLLLTLACGDKDASDDTGPTSAGDGGATATDGGTAGTDGGTDGGTTATGDCATLTWRTEASVFIDTQAELATFCDSWNAVDGDLIVDVGGEADPITELDGIGCLCEVSGDLVITGDSAAPVPGAPPHVTGDIELYSLQRVGGDLQITHHPNLGYVEGLRALTEIGGDLVIGDNPTQQVASFYALQSVGGTVRVVDMEKLLILRLPLVESLGGLEVGAEGDGVTTYYLVEIGLGSVQSISGDFRVVGPRNLSALQAPALTTVGGAFQLQDTCETVPAFGALTTVGSFELAGMCGLADLSGFAALTRITGQDSDGISLRLAANDYVDADDIAAFLGQLHATGTGTVDTSNAGSCAEAMAPYGEGYCD